MKNPQRLIGKKVLGFKFEYSEECSYNKQMDIYIGKVGIIHSKNRNYECYSVLFDNGKQECSYPADQIEAHLVEDEIPTFTKESTENDLLQHIKFCLECKNESQAIRLIEKYAFEKQQINNEEIPTLSDGVMMLVSNSGNDYLPKEVLFKKNNRYYAFCSLKELLIVGYKYAKPLEPTKEEQLIAILGSSEKVSEIMELFKN